MRRTVWRGLCLAVLLAGVPGGASGLVPAEALPGEARASWAAEVARARRERPQAFERLARVAEGVEELDATKRGRLAVLTPHLKGLGPEALWPMVERLVFAPEAPAPAERSARLALSVGLVEAAGALRDARLEPLWKALLEGTEARPLVLHAAAEALLRAYLSHEGEVRQAASNALLRVDAPETASLLTASREGASDAQRAALDVLAERLRRNPLR